MTKQKHYLIYSITNKVNGKKYIGKHETFKINDSYFGSGKLLDLAIKKYGKSAFLKEVIEQCLDTDHLNEREIHWIKELNSTSPNGYNINTGGKGGDTFTNDPNKEYRLEQIRKAQKANKPFTDERREACRIRMTGSKLPPHKKVTCEFCGKHISNANYNRWHGELCTMHPNSKRKPLEEVECEFCNKVVNYLHYHQSHGKFCKHNPNKEHKDYSHRRLSEESLKRSMQTRSSNGNKHITAESNKKRSDKLKGRIFTEEHKAKIGAATKKRWLDTGNKKQ